MAAEDESRKLALPLSFTSLLTIVFLAVTALAGAYVWGVMSGRHGGAAVETAAGTPAKVQKPELPEPDPEILKARELEYAHALKDGQRPVPPKPQPAKPPQKSAEPAAVLAEAVPSSPDAPSIPAGSEVQAPDQEEKPAPGQMYDYVFQLAALKDEQSVDNLRQKLEGRGMRTRMERSGKLFLVLALLRGDETRAAEIIQAARDLRLGEPLLRSKKPAAP